MMFRDLEILSTTESIYTLENSEEAITNGKSRETGNTGYTIQIKTKQNQNTICVGHHYAQKNTNNVNKTLPSDKQLEVKTNLTSFFMRES